MLHPIIYNIILGKRTQTGLPIIPEELIDDKILSIGLFPQTMEHLVSGYNYSRTMLNACEKGGYVTLFIYADTIENEYPLPPMYDISKIVQVYLICTKEPNLLDIISSTLKRKHNERCLYIVNDYQKPWFTFDNVFTDNKDALKYIKDLAPQIIDINKIHDPFYIPKFVDDLDKGLMFNPTVVNTLISHSVTGDWNFILNSHTLEEKQEEAKKAIEEQETFNRQNILLEQIQKLCFIEDLSFFQPKKYKITDEAQRAPLIIVLPFTSSDMRKAILENNNKEFSSIHETFKIILHQKTNKNYTFELLINDDNVDRRYLAQVIQLFYYNRVRFLDIVGLLHASLRFSPYLRLPFQGIEINKELAFFSPAISEKLCNAKDKKSIEKTMIDLGNKIVSSALSKETLEMLRKCPKQLVVITDLPIEWIPINNIPIGFTHDICRLPEFPLESNLMHYVTNCVQHFVIPKDIMNHTLVIYGTRTDSFRKYQDLCDQFSIELGFHTAVCSSKIDFYKKVKEYNPLLLIIDSHGNYEEETHQTYIYLGDEKLYPQDIIDNKIHTSLVFLSACNTAPTYNSVNTLANGFVQAGALSVTSSYLPLNIQESSTLYLRLLKQLSQAATKSIHKNWLSFVSHILRTSYIHSAFKEYYESNKKDVNYMESNEKIDKILTRSMIFEERENVYTELRKGFYENGIHINTSYKIPHYLMYSTIGRADLLNFESFMENQNKELSDIINKQNT